MNSLVNEITSHDKNEDLASYFNATHALTENVEALVEVMEATLNNIKSSLQKDMQELKNAD